MIKKRRTTLKAMLRQAQHDKATEAKAIATSQTDAKKTSMAF